MRVRHPSLDDYDAGAHRQFWAEHIAAHSWAPYCREGPAECRSFRESDVVRSAATVAATEARQRYDAYLERVREVEREGRQDAAARRRELAERKRKQREEWLEYQRVLQEQRDSKRRAYLEAEERRERWLEESAAWEAQQLAEAKTRAVRAPEWGSGTYVLVAETVAVRWNEHPATGHIRLDPGVVWEVGEKLAARLVGAGKAYYV